MQYSTPQPSAGWYPDPAGSGDERYWDGTGWSDVTRPDSRPTRSVDHGGRGIHSAIAQPWTGTRYASWGARVAARVLDGLILTIPSYLLIELLAPGVHERFETWMYELFRAARNGRYYPDIPMELLNSLMTAGIAVMALDILYRALLTTGFGATLGADPRVRSRPGTGLGERTHRSHQRLPVLPADVPQLSDATVQPEEADPS